MIITLLRDLASFLWLTLRPRSELAAENLFLRKIILANNTLKDLL